MSAFKSAALTGIAATLLLPIVGSSPATGRVKVSGRHTMRMVQQQQVAIADHPGHVLLLTEATGTNRNTGPTPYMDGSTLVSSGTADLKLGNGPHEGYALEVLAGDTSYIRWSGKVTTLLSDGVTHTSFEGRWTKLGGTGRFRSITGGGTYQVRFTSPTDYTTEWSGEVQIPRQASR